MEPRGQQDCNEESTKEHILLANRRRVGSKLQLEVNSLNNIACNPANNIFWPVNGFSKI